jgi:hypothetical protein
LSIDLPMRLDASRFEPGKAYPAAIVYGPVVLAARATNPAFVGKIDLDQLDRDLIRVSGEALTWRLSRDPMTLVRPFYAYKEGETYFLYLDPSAAWRVSVKAVTFHPQWNSNANLHFTNAVGATAEYTFEGTGIRWRGFRFDDAGRATVTIDGAVVATVDQYDRGRGFPFEWSSAKLNPGKHSLRLTVVEEKSPESKNHFINLIGFEVLHDN